MLLIGLTASTRNGGVNTYFEQNRDYFDAILRAGALPVLLPLTGDENVLRQALEKVDGVLFTGGADIAPARYGAKLTWSLDISEERDETEMFLMREAVRMKKPLLAICRGIQVMNTALGGTLYQDIEKEVPGTIAHPRSDRPKEPVHEADIVPGTLLHSIMKETRISVNSRHHQAVRDPAPGVTVCCRAEDGIIEGIELPAEAHPFALGVQWHPESLAGRMPQSQSLFDAFIAAATQIKERK
ncbi:MAG: peptidase C26 [Clostridiales bacterium]|nr:peptidase C26 [Clostridiales bacterium]